MVRPPAPDALEAEEAVQVALPPPALAAQVVCCIRRELRPRPLGGAAAAPLRPVLGPGSRAGPDAAPTVTGFVPANVYACLNLVLQGGVQVPGAPAVDLPSAFVTGPFRTPLPTRASVPLVSISLVMQPWLLARWFGLAPAQMIDSIRALPPRSADAPPWLARVCARLAQPAGEPDALEAALGDLACDPSRPALDLPAGARLAALLLEADSVSLAARAAALGERQFERLFARDHGLAPKRWLRIKRFERGLGGLGRSQPDRPASLGHLAADAGYADQGHMTREFRAIAGHTPARLRAALAERSPGFWAFRPVRVGFVQDGRHPDA